MDIKIRTIANGLLVSFSPAPSAGDPLAQRVFLGVLGASKPLQGEIFAHDVTELLGYIAEVVMKEYGK